MMKDHKDIISFLKEVKSFITLGNINLSSALKKKYTFDQAKMINKINDLIRKYESEKK